MLDWCKNKSFKFWRGKIFQGYLLQWAIRNQWKPLIKLTKIISDVFFTPWSPRKLLAPKHKLGRYGKFSTSSLPLGINMDLTQAYFKELYSGSPNPFQVQLWPIMFGFSEQLWSIRKSDLTQVSTKKIVYLANQISRLAWRNFMFGSNSFSRS